MKLQLNHDLAELRVRFKEAGCFDDLIEREYLAICGLTFPALRPSVMNALARASFSSSAVTSIDLYRESWCACPTRAVLALGLCNDSLHRR